ncbi:MAG: HU family DNA-binding protein [Pseudomonadota bacterium]
MAPTSRRKPTGTRSAAAPKATGTRAKSTSKASTSAASPAAKTAAPSTPAPAKGVTAPDTTVTAKVDRELKKKEFFERVTLASGLKKPQAKAAVEAALSVLGEALAAGDAINLEPLGKIKVQKEKDVGAATVYTCRVRRRKVAAKAPKDPLAKAAE